MALPLPSRRGFFLSTPFAFFGKRAKKLSFWLRRKVRFTDSINPLLEYVLMKQRLQQWLSRFTPPLSVPVEEGEFDAGRHVALLIPFGLLYGLDYHPSMWIYDEK